MRSASLVHAKAHLSQLVDLAERQGQLTLICRHGKPAAAIVPVTVATAANSRSALSAQEATSLLERMTKRSSGETTVEEALGRGRLDH